MTLMTLTTLMTLVTLNTLWLWTNCRIFNYEFSDPNFCLVQKSWKKNFISVMLSVSVLFFAKRINASDSAWPLVSAARLLLYRPPGAPGQFRIYGKSRVCQYQRARKGSALTDFRFRYKTARFHSFTKNSTLCALWTPRPGFLAWNTSIHWPGTIFGPNRNLGLKTYN